MPKRFRRPDWRDVPRHDNPIDETKLGFNATSFADGGTQVARTDLLLDPANVLNDPRVVTLKDGKETEVCRLKRRQENF